MIYILSSIGFGYTLHKGGLRLDAGWVFSWPVDQVRKLVVKNKRAPLSVK